MNKRSLFWRIMMVAALCMTETGLHAQLETSKATIEVETVKPHPSEVIHNNFEFSKNRFVLEDQSVLKLIAFAYGISLRQVVGAPPWIDQKRWDVNGTTNLSQDATFLQEQELIRQLLAERFGLKCHHEQRKMSAFALKLASEHSKLNAAAKPGAQALEHTEGDDYKKIEIYTSSSIQYFLTIRQLFMDRPLVDQTGLTGLYDFTLTYGSSDTPDNNLGPLPSIFTAMKEQLGLTFERVKANVDVLVIDVIDQPSAN